MRAIYHNNTDIMCYINNIFYSYGNSNRFLYLVIPFAYLLIREINITKHSLTAVWDNMSTASSEVDSDV